MQIVVDFEIRIDTFFRSSNSFSMDKPDEIGDFNPKVASTPMRMSENLEEVADTSQVVAKPSRHLGHLLFNVFRSFCNASWIFFSIVMTFYGPVIYEEERQRDRSLEGVKKSSAESRDDAATS